MSEQLALNFSGKKRYKVHYRLGAYLRGARVVVAEDENEAIFKLWNTLLEDGTFKPHDYINREKWHYISEVEDL